MALMLLGCVELAKPGCLCPTCQRPLSVATAEGGCGWCSVDVLRKLVSFQKLCLEESTEKSLLHWCHWLLFCFKKFSLQWASNSPCSIPFSFKFIYWQKQCQRLIRKVRDHLKKKKEVIFNYCEWRGSIILYNVGFLFKTMNHSWECDN